MKQALVIATVMASIGCGTDETETRTPIPQDEPRCLSCGYVPPQDDWVPPEPKPHMLLSPSDLMFFPLITDEWPYPPQHATLINLTEQTVDVTSIDIIEDESFTLDENGSEKYFSITEIELPILLKVGESLIIEVWFSFSTEVRAALLTVDTSFDNPDALVTVLTGKVMDIGY